MINKNEFDVESNRKLAPRPPPPPPLPRLQSFSTYFEEKLGQSAWLRKPHVRDSLDPPLTMRFSREQRFPCFTIAARTTLTFGKILTPQTARYTFVRTRSLARHFNPPRYRRAFHCLRIFYLSGRLVDHLDESCVADLY